MGFALGLNRTSAEVAEPILVSVYSLPKVTLYPLILLVFRARRARQGGVRDLARTDRSRSLR